MSNMTIRVRTLDNRAHELNVAPDVEIRSVKEMIREVTEVPGDRQRLIYRGRVMADGDRLSEYSVEDGHTIHMVARPAAMPPPTETQNDDAQNGRRVLAGALDLDAARIVSDALGLGRVAPTRQLGPVGRPGARPGRRSLAGEASLEHVRQGLLTVHTLLSTMEDPSSVTTAARAQLAQSAEDAKEEDAPEPRTAARRPTFYAGQWVDVEDTVHQWLEATVMRVRSRRMLVHYNGWPTRWDEWIDFDSNRVAPFRTRTLHSMQAPYASPSPVTYVDDAPSTTWGRAASTSRTSVSGSSSSGGRASWRARRRNEQSSTSGVEAAAPSVGSTAAAAAPAAAPRRPRGRAARRCRAEDARVAIQETRRALDRVGPLVDCLADLGRDQLLASARVRPVAPAAPPAHLAADDFDEEDDHDDLGLPWAWPPAGRREEEDDSRDRSATDDDCAQRTRRVRSEQLRRVARDAAPLFDRLGRVLSDLAPYVAEIAHGRWSESDEGEDDDDDEDDGAASEQTSAPAPATGAAAIDDEPPPLAPIDEASTQPSQPSATGLGPRRRRRHRRDPTQDDSYRQLVATAARAPHIHAPSTGGNIDIHIHAILTPLRGNANGPLGGVNRDATAAAPAPAAAPLASDTSAASGTQQTEDIGPIVALRARASLPRAAVAAAVSNTPRTTEASAGARTDDATAASSGNAPSPARSDDADAAASARNASYSAAFTNFFGGSSFFSCLFSQPLAQVSSHTAAHSRLTPHASSCRPPACCSHQVYLLSPSLRRAVPFARHVSLSRRRLVPILHRGAVCSSV